MSLHPHDAYTALTYKICIVSQMVLIS